MLLMAINLNMKTKLFFRFVGFLMIVSIVVICFYKFNGGIRLAHSFLSARTLHTEHAQKRSKDICKGSWVDKYKHFHEESLKKSADQTQFLVYWCGGHSDGCGGFGNRIYGIVSMFYLAVLTNRVFLLHWGGPENIKDVLLPDKINWTYNESYLNGTRHKRYWGVWGPTPGFDSSRIESEESFWKWVSEEANYDVLLSHQVESIGSIWYFAEQLKRNPYLKERWQSIGLPVVTESFTLIGCAFEFLFRLSPYMEQQLEAAKSRLKFTHPVIGIHIRTNDHHWGDSNPFSVRTRNVQTVRKCSEEVEKILHEKHDTSETLRWFLAADDVKVKSDWTKNHPMKVITHDSVPMHMERAPSKSTLTDLLVDIFLLSECDFLIGTRDSTFSNVAIGLGQFSASQWLYGEYCDDLDTKKNNDYDYVYNKTFTKLIHPDRITRTS